MKIVIGRIRAFTPLGIGRRRCPTVTFGSLSLSGFTLVEIMIAVGVISILAAIAIPNFVNARLKARESICVNNMRQIDSAKEQWALETGAATTDTPTEAEVGAYIRSGFPSCPSNGTYTIGDLSALPSCSEHGIFPYPVNP